MFSLTITNKELNNRTNRKDLLSILTEPFSRCDSLYVFYPLLW